jgi:curved DNA-binding protein CbpA
MSMSADYYRILGIAPSATAAEIKTAYHAAAKHAHPDAGGSAEAMRTINEAYAVLSNPADRADYDRDRAAPPPPPAATPTTDHSATSGTAPTHATENHAEAQAQAQRDYRRAIAFARRSAAKLFGLSLLTALVLEPTTPLIAAHTGDPTAKTIIALIAFAPLYMLAVANIFLAQPRLRLALAVIGRRDYHLTHHDRTALAGIALAAIPLAVVWVFLFNHGLIH